jgi:P-type Ca2+ transporter type 2C
LVTDGLPATALSFNPPDKDVMKKPPRKHDEPLISGFIFFRYLIIGTYVGLATTAIFIYWYTKYDWAGDNHQLIEYSKLKNWTDCEDWKGFSIRNYDGIDYSSNPCDYFTLGKRKASTLSLTVLVMIEMLNALNALSDEGSLLTVGLFANPLLILAIMGSVILHCIILYIPFFARIFGTAPLTFNDWKLVMVFSLPVIFLDELLKVVARFRTQRQLAERMKEMKR